MSQTLNKNNIHTSSNGTKLWIPCGCGDDTNFVTFEYDPLDDQDTNGDWFANIHLTPSCSLVSRVKQIASLLKGNRFHSDMIMSRDTATALRDWLTKYLNE